MSPVPLFSPLRIRDIEFPNRIGVSPMCQYSAIDGVINDWHVSHIGARAASRPGLTMIEATAVSPEGRITHGCTGLWSDDQIPGMSRLAALIHSHGGIAGLQIGHAGRKASAQAPWLGGKALCAQEGAWQTFAPSPIPFDKGWHAPAELTADQIHALTARFWATASRALDAGFQVLEIHCAHGYLINEFLSPLTNHRTDVYGGPFENRTRFLREIIVSVRKVWPQNLPLFLRISASDWKDGGWTIDDSIALAKVVKPLGVDLIDCSSGGIVPDAKVQTGPGYQVAFAGAVRNQGEISTAAVGMITDPRQANEIIGNGQADLVLMAREFLREPYWPIKAAKALGVIPHVPNQYLRAF